MLLKNYVSKIKNNKFIIIMILLLFLVLGIGAYLFFSSNESSQKDLIIYQKSLIDNSDCYSKSGNLYDLRMHDIIHESLTKYNYDTKKYEIRGLVDSVEDISENNIIVGKKFILKSNIKFHNNKTLKPSDILFTFKRGLEKDPNNVILNKLNIDKIASKCDDHNNVIEIYYKDNLDTSNMLLELSRVYILNQEACTKDANNGFTIGLGFFYLAEFKVNEADDVVLKRFNDFYDQSIKNKFSRIIFKKFADDASAIQEINLTKDYTISLDIKSSNITPGSLNDKVKKMPVHGYSSYILMLNCHTTPLNVRKLIAQSLDMQKIFVELEVDPEYNFVPNNLIHDPDFIGYEKEPKISLRDPQENFKDTQMKVQNLAPTDKKIKFIQSSQLSGVHKRISEKIVIVLKEVGFEVDSQMEDFNLMLKSCQNPDSQHNIVFLGNNWDNIDPSGDIKAYFYVSEPKSEGFDKIPFFQDTEFESLIKNIDEIDPNISKQERLKKIGEILSQKMPVYPIIGEKSGANQILFNSEIKDIKSYLGLIDLKNVFI
ncbi:ABC-type dipeptide/oligopeptide transport system, periplasmatic component [Candidatus Phytoplasma mali]|uniref:ABC-type dipeptide/oligopeptide transport system, periplasmatic component n=1 Tax=Phytoplasma mali (strain AT) TaxID=482235 RepID=B3R091_PHYMT|nr:ABC transporter substrate-binding protein [Candidatus Phytoplasma mali]CAP18255.1 ABC-type dipeptide/oligopeptide transport system, periplasmatic component [Candidatus Phytoplasma mali]